MGAYLSRLVKVTSVQAIKRGLVKRAGIDAQNFTPFKYSKKSQEQES
jgi:hypothetical protein